MVNFDYRSLIHSRYGLDLVRTRISFLKRCFQPKRWFLDSYLERIINQLKQFVTFDIRVLEHIHFDNGFVYCLLRAGKLLEIKINDIKISQKNYEIFHLFWLIFLKFYTNQNRVKT